MTFFQSPFAKFDPPNKFRGMQEISRGHNEGEKNLFSTDFGAKKTRVRVLASPLSSKM